MKRKYDFIVGIGGACCTTQSLRNAGLQYASFPWDWIAFSDIRTRARQVEEDFANWLPREALTGMDDSRFSAGYVWRNERTGMVFAHDFHKNRAFEEEFPEVSEKYRRRQEHLGRLISAAKRVLVVWVDVSLCPRATDADREYVLDIFRRKWPAVEFNLLTFTFEKGRPLADMLDEEVGSVRKVTFDYQDHKEQIWVADDKLLGNWLKAQYEVVDYRTDEERKSWHRRARQKRYARYNAKGFWDYFFTKISYKIFSHLRKRLARKGLI